MTYSNFTYYYILAASYAVALFGWWIVSSTVGRLNPAHHSGEISKPWLQVGGIIIAAILTILIGRLYVNELLIPPFRLGDLRVSESINQLLIYAPFPIFVLLTKQSSASAWLPTRVWGYRLGLGIVLSLAATAVFVALSQKRSIGEVLGDVYHLKNTHHLAQVFMEDFAVALLLSRLAAALGKKYFIFSLVIVGLLFAAGHLPNNLALGSTWSAMINLTIDAGLVVGVGLLLNRSKDFLWFWPIHFAMDMMQFYSGMRIRF